MLLVSGRFGNDMKYINTSLQRILYPPLRHSEEEGSSVKLALFRPQGRNYSHVSLYPSYTSNWGHVEAILKQLLDKINVVYSKMEPQIQRRGFFVSMESNIEQIFQEVISTFGSIEKVESIYGRAKDSECSFFVFIEVSRYDDELMTRLIEKEIGIEDKYPFMRFVFHYIPTIVDKKDVLSSNYSCLLKR